MARQDKSRMSAGQKAAHTRKWRRASQLAHEHARNAKTFTKYILSKKGYKCLSLDSRSGYEYKGVVDLVAIKRDKKDPDSLTLLLMQVKGGRAKVSKKELDRLQHATHHIKVRWNVAEKPTKTVRFRFKL